MALVSDAGTPSVSDPGYRLVRAAVEAELPVFPIPGVSAAVTALSAAGLPTDAFVFIGFPPKKRGKRQELLTALATESRTLVFYESPRRVGGLLEALQSILGDRRGVLARELTKLHEEFLRGRLSEIEAVLADRPDVKGECTLLVEGAAGPVPVSDEQLADLLREALSRPDVHLSRLVRSLAGQYRLPRKRVYDLALEIQKEIGEPE